MAQIESSSSKKTQTKLVMMGLSQAGKSTIYSVALGGKKPTEVAEYDATLEYVRNVRQLASENLVVFDVGGQENFLDKFTGEMAEVVFSEVDVLIYVIDASKLERLPRSKFYFDKAVQQLQKFSPNGKIYVFVHKIDMIPPENLPQVNELVDSYFFSNVPIKVKKFFTSIYDDSLFTALGEIFSTFIKKRGLVQQLIEQFITHEQAVRVAIYSTEGIPLYDAGRSNAEIKKFDKQLLLSAQELFKKLEGSSMFTATFMIGSQHFIIFLPIITSSFLSVTVQKNRSLQQTLEVVYRLRNQLQSQLRD